MWQKFEPKVLYFFQIKVDFLYILEEKINRMNEKAVFLARKKILNIELMNEHMNFCRKKVYKTPKNAKKNTEVIFNKLVEAPTYFQ